MTKTITVRIPCLVDSEGKYLASQWMTGKGKPALQDDDEARGHILEAWDDLIGNYRLVWITTEVPLPESRSIEVKGRIENA